ncbi:cell division protein SepF [Gordonibacter sp. 28C]|uniref:cell division protein SepF n=1 Tax=Gordonibacter sp. 28C TaxID=2078569 RepID=UPI000DF7AFCF|nr:cell division protein SepF [Gordonibacter sp. 28C]RDB60852.1 cell division protein SepF [Gordonibacter sp. 28C]
MELPKIKKSEHGGMFDGIKSKLGFADAAGNAAGYDDAYLDDYGDDFGDYNDEFGDYGPEYDDAPASRYDPYAPVTTRPARGSSRSARSSADADFPKLVSIDDVRAHTQVPDSLRRDPLPARRVTTPSASTSSYRGERTVVDATMPAPSSPAHTAARRERSESLNALFEPSAAEPAASPSSTSASAGSGFAAASSSTVSVATATAQTPASAAATGSFDPYEAYAGSGAPAHNPSRAISVLKPASYGEVERVAKILKAGDVVVLALRNTPDQLSKRILDFSFGVSSALDASVEAVADKVFAITRGASLTEAERLALRNQGVL